MLNSTIDGCIQMKSYLSGNPGLRLALNEDLVVSERGRTSITQTLSVSCLTGPRSPLSSPPTEELIQHSLIFSKRCLCVFACPP